MAASSSTSCSSSSRSLFSCCFDWVSVFFSRGTIESNSMASTLGTTRCMPENEEVGAFHEIAPSASTLGTSSTLNQKSSFDVFINHRGPDVKKTLATRIYNILDNMKVTTFLDSEELEYGDFLPTTLEAAIRSATLHIAIFSESYAESAWCLEELSLMLKSGAKIIPIFCYVEPSDLRYVAQRRGRYVAAFEKHEKKLRYSSEKLKEWKEALYKVSFFNGQIIKNNDDETRLFKNIVNIVLKEVNNVPLIVAKHPVGLNKAVEDFENIAQLDQSVQIVGIWGMGGSGKTTLAKELYNKRFSSMERSIFIFDIREAKGMLHKKQIELLNGLGVNAGFDNVEQGKAILARHLRSFRVLIVLDDVDHADQLDSLLPTKESLGRGSLIIITTRECEVLTSWGISSICKMRALDQFDAEKLFSWHAFLQSSPIDGFKELTKKFVNICDGLPLSLKVFGAQLYGKSHKQYWESLFHKISRILPVDIKEKLKVSYDALDDEEKEAFLDIACFFIGERNSLAIEVWDGSGWSGLHSWERLQNKCLVEIDNKNLIRMHDHLRDLGREIANQHSPYRLWLPQHLMTVDKQTKKRNDIRGIKAIPTILRLWSSYREERFVITGDNFETSGGTFSPTPSLVGLKLLVIRGDHFNQVIGEVSGELVWLRWWDIGQRNLPARLSLRNLRVLEISEEFADENQLEELWEVEISAPLQLRELDISHCYNFQRLPSSIGCLNELKRVVIRYNKNVRSLPEEFCRLHLLEHLELSYCVMLSSLPSSFGDLTNLRYLSLSFCKSLSSLPVSFKNLMLLQYLNLEGCIEVILTSDDFQHITMLEFLSLARCQQLKELPGNITNQASLTKLYLDGVHSLREIPMKIGQLGRLREMKIGSELLISLPDSLGDLSFLTNLSIEDCFNLETLPISLGDLFSLTELSIIGCHKLKCLPLSIGDLSFLTNLSIKGCFNLESLPISLGDLLSLTELSIFGCQKLKCLPFSMVRLNRLEKLTISLCPISKLDFGAASLSFVLSNLKQMELQHTEVCMISISEHHYPLLESLRLFYNEKLTQIEALPVSLERLTIDGCPKLEELPSLARLTSLRGFYMVGCDQILKIEGLKYCTRMETLILRSRWEMPFIESLQHMEKLRTVDLRANRGSVIKSCIQTIQKWPDEIRIFTRAAADASSLVDSLPHSLNLFIVDSISNKDILVQPLKLLQNHSSNGNSIMLCFVINCVSSLRMRIHLKQPYLGDKISGLIASMEIDEGRWALVAVFTQRCEWLNTNSGFQNTNSGFQIDASYSRQEEEGGKVEVERGMAVIGEDQRLVGEAFLPLLQSVCR